MRILIADDERAAAEALASLLRRRGHETATAENGRIAWDLARRQPFDLVLADVRMPEMTGLELTRRLTEEQPEVIVVLITAYASIANAVEALRLGAFDYVTKPVNPDELTCLLERISELVGLRREIDLLRRQVKGPERVGDLIGRDPTMLEAYRVMRTAAKGDLPVLISGETGTGKTVAGRTIHKLSARANGPWVEVNCAAIPPPLFESELFGHVRGAFTGAVRERTGKLRAAHGGTILLDEIGCLDAAGQAKLLQVLDQPHVVPVGADRGTRVDFRLIAATNEELEERVQAGTFRRDLYYRIRVLHIHMPALRHRRSDLPLLIHHLLAKIVPGRNIGVSPSLMQMMLRRPWAGNVRELRNVLEVMIAACDGDELLVRHAPPVLRGAEDVAAEDASGEVWDGQTLDQMMDAYERFLLSERLRRTGGHLRRAAEELGVSVRTLERKLDRHGLRRRDFVQANGGS